MSAQTADLIVVSEGDNVATASHDLSAGSEVRIAGPTGSLAPIKLNADIRLGHKAALRDIAQGDLVIKHGRPIGRATAEIKTGNHVHVHNVISLSRETDLIPAGESQEWR
jgi:altronate dehydratase small subunit